MKFGGNWPSGFRTEVVSQFNNIMILYMYTAQRKGKMTLTELNIYCNFKLFLLQSLLLDTSSIFVCVCVCSLLSRIILFII